MTYNGFEIFYQDVGNADSLFVRCYENNYLTNILIDGGRKGDADRVSEFLRARAEETGISTIHHLVCSHSHDDHAAGLLELVDRNEFVIERAWVHDTRASHQALTESRKNLLKTAGATIVLGKIEESERTRNNLLQALERRKIPISSPFAGERIGQLVVLGPTREFFDAQFKKLDDPAVVTELDARYTRRIFESILDTRTDFQKEAEESQKELGGEPTSPENEVSTVLAIEWNKKIHLLTGDAGCEALQDVVFRTGDALKAVGSMQIPHHGSRRNMNVQLLEHFSPSQSFISADGTSKHPSRKLVNALKKLGGKVYSTHYQGSWLRKCDGEVPPVKIVPATALYDKD